MASALYKALDLAVRKDPSKALDMVIDKGKKTS